MFLKSKKTEDKAKSNVGSGAKPSAEEEGAQDQPSPEQKELIKQGATKSKQLLASFGEIVGLLMRTPQFKNMPLSSLEQLVVPAITTGQFTIAEAQEKRSGFITPVAVVLWASVSEEIDRRLSDNGGERVKLARKDWKSGDIPWLIMAAGDQRLLKPMLQRIEETVLKGRPLKSRSTDMDDKSVAAKLN